MSSSFLCTSCIPHKSLPSIQPENKALNPFANPSREHSSNAPLHTSTPAYTCAFVTITHRSQANKCNKKPHGCGLHSSRAAYSSILRSLSAAEARCRCSTRRCSTCAMLLKATLVSKAISAQMKLRLVRYNGTRDAWASLPHATTTHVQSSSPSSSSLPPVKNHPVEVPAPSSAPPPPAMDDEVCMKRGAKCRTDVY